MFKKPQEIKIEDYSYHLPDDRIAYQPCEPRDASKLLCYKDGNIISKRFYELGSLLPASSLLVMNNSKVIPARIIMEKPSGAKIEIFCLQPLEPSPDLNLALQCYDHCIWLCLVGNLRRWKVNEVLVKNIYSLNEDLALLEAKLIRQVGDQCIVAFEWKPSSLNFYEILTLIGKIPLPPYIKRDTTTSDAVNYQTVYAQNEGSVAAPTAGLHFTPHLINELVQKHKINITHLTLHVGAGTFKPVTASVIGEHQMHAEPFTIQKQTIEQLLNDFPNIIAVGTTSMRTLESLYWIGNELTNKKQNYPSSFVVSQWQPYEAVQNSMPVEALSALLNYLNENNLDYLTGFTELIIAPGYSFKFCKGLITNFHQPSSTLLLLIAAFLGEDWRKIYDFALNNGYRFLSYGDSSLLWQKS